MNYQEKLMTLEEDFGDWWKKGFSVPSMTKNLYPYKSIFSPIKVNTITIKNRLVMAPMGNISMCEETGRPNQKMISYFEERAKGGVGLITTGLIPVSFGIDKSLIELDKLTYFPRVDRSRTVFAGWRDLAAACHNHGAKIFIQLTAGLGRVGNPQCLVNQKKFPRSASFNPNYYMSELPCLRLSDHSLKKIIKNMGQASADSKAANIDGVYLHGHEGYMIEQLTNPAFNRRKIGRYSNYENFGLDMVKEIRKRVGPKFPIMYRIDLSLMLEETYGDRMKSVKSLKKFRGGRTVEQTLKYMENLVKAGVDMFDVDLGCYDNWWLPHPPSSMPAGCFLDIAEISKKYFKDNNIKSNLGLDVPVVAVGKLGYPDLAESALREDKCDMVMLGRPLLADPDWPEKAFRGDLDKIRPCIGCQEGCVNEFVEGGHPQCAVNPRTAFEHELDSKIEKVDKAKKVAVIGAGPSGVVASQVLVAKGHKVDLFEARGEIGGNVVPGATPYIKYEIKNYLTYLNNIVDKLGKNSSSFKLYLNKKVEISDLKDKYDVVLFASGSAQSKPPIKGIENKNVVFATDLLRNPKIAEKSDKIVVIGGGVVGCETAYFLKYEMGKDVKVVEMDFCLMNHTCTANRGHLIHYLEKADVELLTYTKLLSIEDGGITVEQNIGKNRKNPYNTWAPILPENILNPLDKKVKDKFAEKKIDADLVVLSVGAKEENKLFYEAQKENIAKEIYIVGDAFKTGKIFEAVRSAYRKALTI